MSDLQQKNEEWDPGRQPQTPTHLETRELLSELKGRHFKNHNYYRAFRKEVTYLQSAPNPITIAYYKVIYKWKHSINSFLPPTPNYKLNKFYSLFSPWCQAQTVQKHRNGIQYVL